MAEEEVDFSKLSLEDRCGHKNWKARVSAYDELNKIFQKIYEEKHPDWAKYGNWVRKFPTDSNAAAQEKALEVTLLYLQRAGSAGRIVTEVMSGVVSKCITAAKAKSKELAVEIALTGVEIEKQEQVQEELSKGMEQKNPKVVAGCIAILSQILREFGAKVVNLKPLVKKIPSLCEDRDKTVREETKKLIVELYRWIGAALRPQLAALKPVMVQELETDFGNLSGERPHPTRLLRSEQAKQEEAGHGDVEEGEDGEDAPEEAAPEIDPLDLIDPVDVLSKIPKDFYEKCEAKKWQERKEAVEALETLVSHPKLEPGDYADLVRTLKRLIGKDTNILVVTLAGKCIAALATGLKKKFSPYAVSCIGTILEKFKEKKATVVAAMRAAIDASFEATTLEAIQEETIQALQNKNPAVKTETSLFLARAFAKTPYKTMSDKKLMKGYLTAILSNLNESDPGVRDAAAETMGVAYKHLGEKNMAPYTSDLEAIKLQKVKEFAEKAVITAPKAPAEKKPKAASAARSETNVGGAPKKAAVKKPSTAPAGDKRSIRGGGGKAQPASPSKEEIEEDLPVDAGDPSARTDIGGLLTESLMVEMNDKNWKVREEALDKVRNILSSKKNIMPSLGDLPQNLAQRLNDSNKNLAVSAFLVCQNLAPALGPYCKNHIQTFLPNMLSGLSDTKISVRAQVTACIDAWADNAGVQELFQCEFIADALKSGNHFTRIELYNWLASRLPTMKSVNKDEMHACLPYVYTSLEDRTAEVRRAAQEVLMPIMMHIGYEVMLRNTSKFKPGTEKVVKTALEKARNDLPLNAPSTMKPSSGAGGKGSKSSSGSALPRANRAGSDTNLSADAPAQKGKNPRATMSKPTAKTSPNSKKAVDDPIGCNLPLNSPKQQRILDETRLKILRWTFTLPREEFIELLKDLMTNAGIGKTLMGNMFSSDFKMHIRALDTLLEELNYGMDGTISNLDLVLKWLTLRFFDTNPTVLIRSLDYLSQVFKILGEVGYQMPDIEANAFIPYLLMKIGDPKENVKSSVHGILRLVSMVHSPQRVFTFIMDGIKSKNARQRTECLDELAHMIANIGVSVIQPSPAAGLKEIARQISDRDNGVRNAALNAVVQVYHYEGDRTYKMIGQLADKDQSLLDERIKRAGKQRPPIQQQPPPPIQQQRSNHSSFGSNSSSPNATTLSPQGNSKLIPPSIVSNTILQPQNLNTTMVTALNNEDDDEMMMAPPPARQSYAPQPQEQPKVHVLPEKYRLDFETIENMFRDEPPLTQLTLLDTNIDGFMKQKPPSLPTRKMVAPVAPTLTKDKTTKLPPSRACQSIDLIISQVGQTELRASMEALTQLDSMISDASIVQIMTNRVDHMLSMTSLQIHRLQATIESANPERLSEVNKFYRCAVAFLTSLYKGEFLPQKASKETIKDLIQNLLLLIIDPSLERLPDAAPIVRLINIMVVRIIEKSDPNSVTCALIRLLNETLTSSKQPRMLDLVMKCQWKLLKQFSVWEQWNYDWDVSAILTEFNMFMRNHPFSSFQGQDITPLKTMKTILHALVVHLGGEVIAQHLSFMPEVQDSEAGLYINKVIQREMGKKRHGQGNSSGTPASKNNHSSGGGGRTAADSNSSNNVSGRNAIAENYNQVSNPNNNVNDFMNSLPDPSDAPTDEAQEQAYMQRVRMILMRGGLNVPRGPSVTLSKNLNDGGEESSI